MKISGVKQYYTVALFELMKTKPFDEISVCDLVRESGASRASFYRNYSSKEQIIEEYIEKAFGDTFMRHPLTAKNMRLEVRHIFEEIYEQRPILNILKLSNKLDILDQRMYLETLRQINHIGV